MKTARIAIVGAGLSGLYAAWLLERQGIHDYVVLEARDVLGGRIASISGAGQTMSDLAPKAGDTDRFDLGPAWFWPGYQLELHRLINDLGLERFPQFEMGDMVVERTADGAPVRMRGFLSSPASTRLIGGMAALVDALYRELEPVRIVTGHVVRRLRGTASHIELDCEDATSCASTWSVDHVLLALPPRLVESSIAFEPALPHALARQWRMTATWMAPHAKYIAIYETPFWRDQGLSGEARSARGPLGEIHDASMPGGSAALFGFFGIPAHLRRNMPEEVLRAQCRAQFVRLFGPQAGAPRVEAIKDWAGDPFTATAADMDAPAQHADAPVMTAASGPWRGRLTGIGSEWSSQFPGYLAGAIEAATFGVQSLVLGAGHASAAGGDTATSGQFPKRSES